MIQHHASIHTPLSSALPISLTRQDTISPHTLPIQQLRAVPDKRHCSLVALSRDWNDLVGMLVEKFGAIISDVVSGVDSRIGEIERITSKV